MVDMNLWLNVYIIRYTVYILAPRIPPLFPNQVRYWTTSVKFSVPWRSLSKHCFLKLCKFPFHAFSHILYAGKHPLSLSYGVNLLTLLKFTAILPLAIIAIYTKFHAENGKQLHQHLLYVRLKVSKLFCRGKGRFYFEWSWVKFAVLHNMSLFTMRRFWNVLWKTDNQSWYKWSICPLKILHATA